ncbi:MAG TPA: serine protease [Rhizomicrobium sp.]|nr:serine protease [Rhizomicrobium sp.]
MRRRAHRRPHAVATGLCVPGGHSRRYLALCAALALTGCATASGIPATAIPQPDIAAAYLPLKGRIHLGLDRAAGAAVIIGPGIAVTNAHNANLVDAKSVIGTATLSDLLFFRTARSANPATAMPKAGETVTAYGQDLDGKLRLARGVVREIVMTPGYEASPYFIFTGDAGPGFSGGPVVDGDGRLIGITFGYKDQGQIRLIYAYDMARVRAEFSRLGNAVRQG